MTCEGIPYTPGRGGPAHTVGECLHAGEKGCRYLGYL